MEADKDFIKTSLGNEHADAETTFTHLTNSHVKADINLGSLGVVSDNMSVTVDSSSIDHHLKVDVGLPTATLLQGGIPENLVLVETSKGLVLSVADGTSDFSNFGGNCIASVADENGRPIITSSLQGGIFSHIQQVGVMEDNQGQVYENEAGNQVVIPVTIFTDTEPPQTENQTEAVSMKPDDQKKKKGGGWPKGKKRKAKPEFEPPRKPMTGYVIFALKRRQELKVTNPKLQFHVITRMLGQEWSNMAKDEKERYSKLAEEDKQRYIREMQEFQDSDVYQAFVKNKKLKGEHLQGLTDNSDAILDLEDTDGLSELHCKLCNQYFTSVHNKKEHMFGRQHLKNITTEIRQDIEKQTALQKQEMILATSLDSANLNGQDSLNISRVDGLQEFDSSYSESSSLDLFDFVKNFMEKNVEREQEINILRRSKENHEFEKLAISKQIKELEEYESKLDQDLESLKAYGASLTAQVNALKMVPTLFGVINF